MNSYDQTGNQKQEDLIALHFSIFSSPFFQFLVIFCFGQNIRNAGNTVNTWTRRFYAIRKAHSNFLHFPCYSGSFANLAAKQGTSCKGKNWRKIQNSHQIKWSIENTSFQYPLINRNSGTFHFLLKSGGMTTVKFCFRNTVNIAELLSTIM